MEIENQGAQLPRTSKKDFAVALTSAADAENRAKRAERQCEALLTLLNSKISPDGLVCWIDDNDIHVDTRRP